jgi:hypothetical protein
MSRKSAEIHIYIINDLLVTMEPITSIAIAGAVGGAAGKFIETAWGSGEKWLSHYFKDHQPKAQEAARQNALDFLAELASRIHVLELTINDLPDARTQIENALSDPDFSAILQKTIIASSRTASEDKHKLLAHLVSDRLLADNESFEALSEDMVCDAIQHLNQKQLRILGVLHLVYNIRSDHIPTNGSRKELYRMWCEWFSEGFSLLMLDNDDILADYLHLQSLSCINYSQNSSWDLRNALSIKDSLHFDWAGERFLEETEIGKKLTNIWTKRMNHAFPTIVGMILGKYVYEELIDSKI